MSIEVSVEQARRQARQIREMALKSFQTSIDQGFRFFRSKPNQDQELKTAEEVLRCLETEEMVESLAPGHTERGQLWKG